jgi:hypothetical protein
MASRSQGWKQPATADVLRSNSARTALSGGLFWLLAGFIALAQRQAGKASLCDRFVQSPESGLRRKCSRKAVAIRRDDGFGESGTPPWSNKLKRRLVAAHARRGPTTAAARKTRNQGQCRSQHIVRQRAVLWPREWFDRFVRALVAHDAVVRRRCAADDVIGGDVGECATTGCQSQSKRSSPVFRLFHTLSHRSINKHNCRLSLPLHHRVNLIAPHPAALTHSSGTTRHFIR